MFSLNLFWYIQHTNGIYRNGVMRVCPVSIRIRERIVSNSTRNPFISFSFPSRGGGGILILRRIFVTEYHERNWKMDALAMDIHIPFWSFWKHCSGKSCWMRRARCNWRFSNLASHETRKRSWQRKYKTKQKILRNVNVKKKPVGNRRGVRHCESSPCHFNELAALEGRASNNRHRYTPPVLMFIDLSHLFEVIWKVFKIWRG